MKTQSEIEAAICAGISRFEQETRGRGPKGIQAHLLGDVVVVQEEHQGAARLEIAGIVGGNGQPAPHQLHRLQRERIALAAMAVGHATVALRLAVDYTKQRKAFGGALWDRQAIRQRLAMLEAKTRAARTFMYHCAWRVAEGRDAVKEISMLKALTGELAGEVVTACQQFHGGMGYIRETAIERLWRAARILAIGGGATEVMLEEVAKRL